MRDHLLGLLLYFTLQFFGCKQDTPSGSLGKSDRTEVENVIHARAYFEGDTVALHTNLDSLLEIAEFKRSIPLKWAYYQRIADGFSMAFDGVNPRSDHYYRKAEDLVRNTRYDGLRQAGIIREGHYYFVYREISKALPCFLAADELRKKVKASDLPLFAKQ